MEFRPIRALVALLLGAMAVLGCGQEQSVERATQGSARPGFDAASVVQRVHFAFRAEGGLFTGGHSTYGVTVAGARVSVSPFGESRQYPAPTVAAPLVLESAVIARGDARLPLPELPALQEDGTLAWQGTGVSAHLENREGGVELSWRFSSRPAGRGALDVRVPAAGLTFVGETEGGLHFRDPATTLGVRVGKATWIEANDRRTPVAARWDGHDIVVAVPAELVEGAAYPVLLDPLIGPETAVDVPLSGVASGQQYDPSVAFSGSEYFVVWTDYRTSAYWQTFGTRVATDGSVLDPDGIVLSPPGMTVYGSSVVWDGTDYLVVFGGNNDVLGQRVTPDGDLVDPAPFVVAEGGTFGVYNPTAFNNGVSTLVVWEDYRDFATNRVDLYGTRVAGATAVDGTGGIALSTASGDQRAPRVTYGGGNWFVVWDDQRADHDVYGARLEDATGALLDPVASGLPISNALGPWESSPWPASDGTDYFVVWYDDRNQATNGRDVYGARVTAAGTVDDPAGINLSDDAAAQFTPSVAYNGGNYQVVWYDERGFGLYGNRVEPSTGTLLDGASGALLGASSDYAYDPHIFATGTDFYVVWTYYSGSSNGDLFGSRLTIAPLLEDAPGVNLATSANGQNGVDIASDGNDRWLVVWQDDRGGSRGIYGMRVDDTGTPLDASAILISPGGFSALYPAVAFNGTHFLVVWNDSRAPSWGLWGARVDPLTGELVDPAGLGLFLGSSGNQPYQADVASDGNGWLVTWNDGRNSSLATADIYGGLVGPDGVPLDPVGFPIAVADGSQLDSEVAFGSDRYLVVWTDWRNAASADLYAARVTPGGSVEDPSGIPIATGPTHTVSDEYGIAYADSHFFIAHNEEGRLWTSRVLEATGEVVGATQVAPCCNTSRPAVAFDGTRFFVVYSLGAFGSDLMGSRFATDGSDLDATDFSVQSGGVNPRGAALAAIPGGVLAAYARYDGAPGVRSERVMTRLISRSPAGAECTIDDDCESTHCADGVCCDSACGGSDSGDCQACSVTTGAASDGVCGAVAPGYDCRPAAGSCDVAESCDGASIDCPGDLIELAGTVCRPEVAGGCDMEELCDGLSADCPGDVVAAADTVCRDSTGACDPAESCTGSSPACPDDELAAAGTSCRAPTTPCDAEESCTGVDTECPSDELELVGAECRPAAGLCDPAEYCTGFDLDCPPDELVPALSECRSAAGPCDVAEYCTGIDAECPFDSMVAAGTECHASAGDCDPAELCTGLAPDCPADALSPSTTVCRAAVGPCDKGEKCTGVDLVCPADVHRSTSYVCRAAIGECDVQEKCDGVSDTCPTDVLVSDGTSCDVGCTLSSQCSAGACVLGASRLALTPTSVEFADGSVGLTSAFLAVTMTNQTADSLEIASIDDSGEFPVFTEAIPPFSIAAGASEVLQVAFAPLRPGPRSTSIEITTASCTFALPVSGVGIEGQGGAGGEGGASGEGGQGASSGQAGESAVAAGGAVGSADAGAGGDGPAGGASNSPSAGQGGAAGEGGAEAAPGHARGLYERSDCRCHAPGASTRGSSAALWLAPLALVLRRRRRSRSALAQHPHDAL